MTFTPDELAEREKAIMALGSMWGRSNWRDTGAFDVPGAIMRGLVTDGFAEARKRSPSAPAEYKGTYKAEVARLHWLAARGHWQKKPAARA